MARFAVLLTFLLSSFIVVSAQPERRWILTPRVGVNSSNITGLQIYMEDNDQLETSSVDVTHKFGLTLGADVQYKACKRLVVSFGWFYSNESFKYNANMEEGKEYIASFMSDKQGGVNLHYFNFPVLLNVYVFPWLAVKGGIQIDGMIAGRHKYDGESNSRDVLNSFSSVGFSLPVGLSCDIGAFTADVRYAFGVCNLCNVATYNSLNAKWKLNSLWMTLGYRFKL